MTASGLWQDIGAGENFFTKLLRLIFLLAAAAAFCFLAILPLTWPQQAVWALMTLLMALAMALELRFLPGHAHPDDDVDVLHLPLWVLARHAGDAVLSGPGDHWGALDVFFILCLLGPRPTLFSFCFWDTSRPSGRCGARRYRCRKIPDEWPHVDVLIPTYQRAAEMWCATRRWAR
jgi:cellulose synthase (UDP-forming)